MLVASQKVPTNDDDDHRGALEARADGCFSNTLCGFFGVKLRMNEPVGCRDCRRELTRDTRGRMERNTMEGPPSLAPDSDKSIQIQLGFLSRPRCRWSFVLLLLLRLPSNGERDNHSSN